MFKFSDNLIFIKIYQKGVFIMKKINALKRKRETLWKELCTMKDILQGTLVEAYLKCGKVNCHCASDEKSKHGPKFYLFYKEKGKPKMLYIRRDKVDEVRRRIKRYKHFKEILASVNEINRELLRKEQIC